MAHPGASAWDTKDTRIPQQMYNIIADNTQLLTKILKISQTELQNTIQNYKDPTQLKTLIDALLQRGLIQIPANDENLQLFKENIGRAYDLGTNNIQPTTKPLLDTYKSIIQDNEVKYLTNVTDKQRKDVGKILTDAIENKTMPKDIIQQLSNKAGLRESRAGSVTRTAMMRASNGASYAQNSAEGSQYFIVDHRSTACKYCIKAFSRRVYNINEAKFIPPFHNNCACVPMFFNTREEAEAFANDVYKRNQKELQILKDKGVKIPGNGSGPNINLHSNQLP